MSIKTTIFAATLASSCLVSSPVMANENTLQGLVTSLVKGALLEVSNDIETNITKNVLSTSYQLLEAENGEQVVGKVTITDLEDIPADDVVQEDCTKASE